MNSKKVLITGGTGFIGKNVVDELLTRGYQVHSLVYPPFVPEQENLFQYEMNLLDTEQVNKFLSENHFDTLIHLAWYVGKGCQTSNKNIDWLMASLNLLQSFKMNGGTKFLATGSVSEYDYKYGYCKECSTPTNSGTLYGVSKNSFYNIAKSFCKWNDINFKWARIFNLYGPDEKIQRLVPSVINSCLKNEDVKVSHCKNYLDYLHVKDVARGIVDVFESELNDAVNICSGEPVQLREIVEKIVELTNYKGQVSWGALTAAFDDNVVFGNNEKLKSIGWIQRYSLGEGLKQTIDWWKENNNGI